MLTIDRRTFVAGSAAGLLFLTAPGALLAQETVNIDDLHAPGQLGDKVLGAADAPVTVVEYASMSCPHCGAFHRDMFDDFRLKYVDSGKVRFVFREFPLNAAAFAVAMVARCAPADRFFDVIRHLFRHARTTWLQQVSKHTIYKSRSRSASPSKALMPACRIRHCSRASKAVKNRGAGIWRAGHADLLYKRQEVARGRCHLRTWTRRSSRCSSEAILPPIASPRAGARR